jgi:hypothetical protein
MSRIRIALALIVALPSLALAEESRQPAEPPVVVIPAVPERTVVTDEETRMNTELIGSGLVVFGLSYGTAVVVAATSDNEHDQRLYVPVIGPWLDLADRGSCPVDSTSCDSETRNKILLVIDGVFQAGGITAAIVGVFTPHRTRVTSTVQRGVKILPVSMGRGSPGIGVIGRF